MDIKQMFLNLTQYTIPHGKEDTLSKYMPAGSQRDEFGNYHITIGNSETLFTSHLDTCCTKYEKVNHVIDGNKIGTDGTTILGGDNKTGVVILLNMIEHNIPGTYYFFAGEEPTAKDGGLYGSKNLLASNPQFLKKFKRAISFDRKKEGSFVIRQMARFTCSKEFIGALIEQLADQGLEFAPDQTGWYTDVAVFIDIIPEVANLSSGTYNEHSTEEFVDINYLQRVADAALKINWESLPTVREAKKESSKTGNTIQKFGRFKNLKSDTKLFNIISYYFSNFGFRCLNSDEFEPGLDMIFSKWHEDVRVLIKIKDGIIFFNNQRVGNLKEFEKALKIGFEQKVDLYEFMELLDKISEKINSYVIDTKILEKALKIFGVTLQDFEEYYASDKCALKDFLKYDKKKKRVTLI